MPRRLKRAAISVAIAGLVLVALHAARGGDSFELLMCFAPFVLVAIPLLRGHYVGEQLLADCRQRRSGRRPPARSVSVPSWFTRAMVNRGRLVARDHGERGPPRVACA
jgi:hypothetical protein